MTPSSSSTSASPPPPACRCDLLPKQIDGVRIIGIDVPGFGVPTHAEAKDVLAGAMLRYARLEAEAGPVARPKNHVEGAPTVALIGELFPADPVGIGALLAPLGLSVAPQTPAREWRDLYGALDSVVAAAVHPFYTASIREFRAAGRPVVGSGPVGVEGTAAWLEAIGRAANCRPRASTRPRRRRCRRCRPRSPPHPISARVTVSGYEGSELLVARLLVEAGAEVPYVGTACPRTEWSEADRAWLAARGVHVQYRASLEQDVAAMEEVKPDLAIGTTPLVQRGKELGIPSLYFTNMVSARPLFGPAGAASMAVHRRRAQQGASASAAWSSFFEGVGTKDGAGYGFTSKPTDPPGFRDRQRKQRLARAKAEEAVGT